MSIVCQQVFLTFFDIFQNNPAKSLIYWVCGYNIFLHFYHKKPVFYSFLYNNTHFLLYFFLYFFQIILKHIQFCYFHPHPLFISLQNFSITHTLSYAEQAFLISVSVQNSSLIYTLSYVEHTFLYLYLYKTNKHIFSNYFRQLIINTTHSYAFYIF